ncbi:ATP-binding protein [Streptomyces montanisoli]|uniref:ATP-binding protein n=1 Tax=Streptomyces montanisoli TaxID=2798581 RepID=A0A940MDJ9_9ACTN|nr:ATP-binding protein [Streptomyces montanisoli]MBP0458411.1 ATP-binding protein [Streptomyces montanisoli]
MVGLIDTEDESAEWILPSEPGAVRVARHDVRDTLRAWRLSPGVEDVAMLLVSELVTNSLTYAPGPIGMRLEIRALSDGESVLLVEVSDQVPGAPVVQRAPGPEDERGRGLQLVASSARRWGTRRGKTGKTVWFELPLHG